MVRPAFYTLGTRRTGAPGPREVLSCPTTTHGILSRVLERRSRREGALLIAGSEHEEEVAEIKRGGEGGGGAAAAGQRRESRALPQQEVGSQRSGCPQGSQRLPTPARTLICPLPVFMASPDDPLRSGKVARCRALTWGVTTSWICKTELQSPREHFWTPGLAPDVCRAGWEQLWHASYLSQSHPCVCPSVSSC